MGSLYYLIKLDECLFSQILAVVAYSAFQRVLHRFNYLWRYLIERLAKWQGRNFVFNFSSQYVKFWEHLIVLLSEWLAIHVWLWELSLVECLIGLIRQFRLVAYQGLRAKLGASCEDLRFDCLDVNRPSLTNICQVIFHLRFDQTRFLSWELYFDSFRYDCISQIQRLHSVLLVWNAN